MKKRILAMLTAVMIGVLSIMPAMADTTTTKTETGTSDCTVTTTVASSYTVTLPLTIALTAQSDGSYSKGYSINVEGTIPSTKKVTVTPASSFTMTGDTVALNTVTANVTQTTTNFGSAAISAAGGMTASDGSIAVTSIPYADSYTGTLTFTIGLVDA